MDITKGEVMTGRKQQIKPKDKKDAENAKVQMHDVHFNALISPRDAASGQAKS